MEVGSVDSEDSLPKLSYIPTARTSVDLRTRTTILLKVDKAKSRRKTDPETGLEVASTATRDQILSALETAKIREEEEEAERAAAADPARKTVAEERSARNLMRVSTLVSVMGSYSDEVDINLTRPFEVQRLVEERADVLGDMVVDLTHDAPEEQHASTVGFVKLDKGGVISKKDMQQFKKIYQEIEGFSRRGTITLPAFRRYLAALCPTMADALDRPTNTSMYLKITRGQREHFSLGDFMSFMYPHASKREIELACTMVGERIEKPHYQIPATVIREVLEIFRFWNAASNGEITWDELKGQLLMIMGILQTEEMMVDARKYDDDRSGGLNFREFMFWWTAGGQLQGPEQPEASSMKDIREQARQLQKARDPVHVLNTYVQNNSRHLSYADLADPEDAKMMEHVRRYLMEKNAEAEALREKDREKSRARAQERARKEQLRAEMEREHADRRAELEASAERDAAGAGQSRPGGRPGAPGGPTADLSINQRLRMLVAKSDLMDGKLGPLPENRPLARGGDPGPGLMSLLAGIEGAQRGVGGGGGQGSGARRTTRDSVLVDEPSSVPSRMSSNGGGIAELKRLAHQRSLRMMEVGAASPAQFADAVAAVSREVSRQSLAGAGPSSEFLQRAARAGGFLGDGTGGQPAGSEDPRQPNVGGSGRGSARVSASTGPLLGPVDEVAPNAWSPLGRSRAEASGRSLRVSGEGGLRDSRGSRGREGGGSLRGSYGAP